MTEPTEKFNDETLAVQSMREVLQHEDDTMGSNLTPYFDLLAAAIGEVPALRQQVAELTEELNDSWSYRAGAAEVATRREVQLLHYFDSAKAERDALQARLTAVETQLSRWNLACRCNCVACSQMFAAVRAAASGQEG